jgi:hypothetical protein
MISSSKEVSCDALYYERRFAIPIYVGMPMVRLKGKVIPKDAVT